LEEVVIGAQRNLVVSRLQKSKPSSQKDASMNSKRWRISMEISQTTRTQVKTT